MGLFTYIIYSERLGVYYKGFTTDPERRVQQHNRDKSRYTAGKGPWKLVYLREHLTKKEALIEERKLKRAGSDYLQRIIKPELNMLN